MLRRPCGGKQPITRNGSGLEQSVNQRAPYIAGTNNSDRRVEYHSAIVAASGEGAVVPELRRTSVGESYDHAAMRSLPSLGRRGLRKK